MRWGRAYFGVQAVAGLVWWILVPVSPPVRIATLGSLDAGLIAILDIPLFVVSSALAALGLRWAAYLVTGWTVAVTVFLAIWATVSTEAGWGVLAMIAASAGTLGALMLLVCGRLPTEWLVTGPFRFQTARSGRRASAHVFATAVQMVAFWGGALLAAPLVIRTLENRWQLTVELPDQARIAGGRASGAVQCSRGLVGPRNVHEGRRHSPARRDGQSVGHIRPLPFGP